MNFDGLTDEEFAEYQKAKAVARAPVSKGDTIVIHSSKINGTFLVNVVKGNEDGFGVSMECGRVEAQARDAEA